MKYLKYLLVLCMIALLSCGGNDNNEPDSLQPANKFPNEIVGTWELYSGDPVPILSRIEENDILNQTFIFVANGNINESIAHHGKYTSANGNWFVENKQLKFTDWHGNEIGTDCSYKINADSSLTLTISGKSAIYFKQDDIKVKYHDLLVGSWNNGAQGAGRVRMTFNKNGRGYSQSTYINDIYYAGEPFSWSYNNKVITVDYDNVAKPIGLHEYVINFLNKKSISWTFENETRFYVRE